MHEPPPTPRRRPPSRILWIVAAALVAPVVPFLLWAEPIERWIVGLFDPEPSRTTTALLVAGALATDVILPVPSSFVSTYGGAKLGTLAGAAASWVGMTVGAVLAFALARYWGRPLAERLSSPDDLARMDDASRRVGPWAIVLTRAVPVLAEACVLVVGVNALSWRRFLPAIALSNLGVALAYSAFGDRAAQQAWLPAALGISAAAPLLLIAAVRWRQRRMAARGS